MKEELKSFSYNRADLECIFNVFLNDGGKELDPALIDLGSCIAFCLQ